MVIENEDYIFSFSKKSEGVRNENPEWKFLAPLGVHLHVQLVRHGNLQHSSGQG